MLTIDIPDFGLLQLEHLVLDYNGTLACDGQLVEGALPRLQRLASKMTLHVVTADTYGRVRQDLAGHPLQLEVLPPGDQARAKEEYVLKLGADQTAAMGNGRNDHRMLRSAALGLALLQEEGLSPLTLAAADVLCRSLDDALDLLLHPLRLVATLRS